MKLSRRQLAMVSGSILVGAALPEPSTAQSAPAQPATPSTLLAERQAAVARSREELLKFELAYGDEPLFRLVVR